MLQTRGGTQSALPLQRVPDTLDGSLHELSPVVSQLRFDRGPVSGGTSVAILGSNFRGGSVYRCRFGGSEVVGVFVLEHNELHCVTPPWAETADARIELTLNGDPQPPAITQLGVGYWAERDGLSYSFVGKDEPAATRWRVVEYPSPPPPPAPPPPQQKIQLSNDEIVRRLASARRTGTFDMTGAYGRDYGPGLGYD